jgi:putative oxidoreductase
MCRKCSVLYRLDIGAPLLLHSAAVSTIQSKGVTMKFLRNFEPVAYTLLRVIFGFLYACHGAQKLFGVLGGQAQLHNRLMLVAGVIELAGGALIALGLLTRIAAFISSGEMAFAYFSVHAKGGFFPIINHGELAVIYCFVALFIACHGAGQFAIQKDS